MQRNLQIILTATTASILTFTAMAQDNNTPQSYRPAIGSDRANGKQPGRLDSAAKAGDIIGTTVKNPTNEVTDADNSGRNVRDRNDRTLTPFDQGNSQADTDATAQIRKGILDVKDMSVKAKNVKIITNNGRVTLRGPVASAEEKRLIGEIADRIAGTGNVDNQLEATNETPGK